METSDSDEDSSVNGDISESSDSTEPEVKKHKRKKKKLKKMKQKKDLCETSESDISEGDAKHHKKRKKKTSSYSKPAPKSGLNSPMMPLAAAATASPQTVSLDFTQLSNLVQYVQ